MNKPPTSFDLNSQINLVFRGLTRTCRNIARGNEVLSLPFVLITVSLFFQTYCLAKEIPQKEFEEWGKCRKSSDCVLSSWGSCTWIAVNKSAQTEVDRTYDPNVHPLQEMTVSDSECINKFTDCTHELPLKCAGYFISRLFGQGTCEVSVSKRFPPHCSYPGNRMVEIH